MTLKCVALGAIGTIICAASYRLLGSGMAPLIAGIASLTVMLTWRGGKSPKALRRDVDAEIHALEEASPTTPKIKDG